MNIRQKCFAEMVASGMPPARAYFEAGYSARGKAAETRAARLLEKDEVVKRIADLRGVEPEYVPMPKIKILRILEKIIRSETADVRDRVEAIKIHCRMVGVYAPTRIIVDASDEMLKAILEGPMTMEEALKVIGRNVEIDE